MSGFTLAGNAQIDEGLLRVISLDSLISPEYTNNRADWRNACYSFRCLLIQRAGHFGEVGGGDMGVAQVVLMERCPSSSWIRRRSVPPSSKCVAKQCLRPWKVIRFLMPAFFTAARNTSCMLRTLYRSPVWPQRPTASAGSAGSIPATLRGTLR